ncbi:hypothetical protein ACTW1T_000307 [Cronobacter sakazakii]
MSDKIYDDADLVDLRCEIMAQQTVIRILLNELEPSHGERLRNALSKAINTPDSGSLVEFTDDEGKQRLELVRNKLKHYVI